MHPALAIILGCALPEPGAPEVTQTEDGPTDDVRSEDERDEAVREFLCDGGLSAFEVCPCDVEVDWSRLTEDVFGEPVQPATFRNLGFARMTTTLSVDEILDEECAGDAEAASMDGYVDLDIWGVTSASLSDMSFLGRPADPLELGRTYWLFWSDESEPGVGTRMMALLSVVEDGADSIEIVWP
jgi:hypothetical protein